MKPLKRLNMQRKNGKRRGTVSSVIPRPLGKSYNGSNDLSKWSINFEIEASMGNTDGAGGHHMKKTSEKNSWRVPEHGVLELTTNLRILFHCK